MIEIQHGNGKPQQSGVTAAVRPAIAGIQGELMEGAKTGRRLTNAPDISKAVFRFSFENATEGIFVFDSESLELQMTNPALRSMLGYEEPDLVQTAISAFLPPMLLDEMQKKLEKGPEDRTLSFDNVSIQRKDGAALFADLTVCPVGDSRMHSYLGQLHDVTGRKRMEDELLAKAMLLDLTGDGVFFVDMRMNIFYVNDAACRQLGYSREEFLGLNLRELAMAGVHDHIRERMRDVQSSGSAHFETTLRRKDGSAFSVEVQVNLVALDGRHYALAVVRDITEKKQTEYELLESRRRFQETAEILPCIICEIDMTGRFIYVNRLGLKSFGYTPEDLDRGIRITQVVHPDEEGRMWQNVRSVLKGQPPGSSEYRMRKKDGTTMHYILNSLPMMRDGAVIGLRTCLFDIGELKQTEARLRESEERNTALLAAIPDLIFRIRGDGTVLDYSSAREDLALPPDKTVGSNIRDLPYSDDGKKRVLDAIESVIARGETQTVEYVLPMPQGPMHYEARIVRKSADEVISIVRNVTEKKRAETELQRAQKLESLGVLAGGIAHDFNNLLFAAFGNLDLARRQSRSNPAVQELLDKAMLAFGRAKDLTHQLLTFSKGGQPVKVVASLKAILQESISLSLTGSNLRCEFIPPDPDLTVEADKGQLGQVFSNIIINARQAMPEGGRLAISLTKTVVTEAQDLQLPPGGYAVVSVADEGIGIPEKILPRIFDPFFTTKQQGSGLGLAIVYSIVKNHGGKISVFSKMGEGTTVTVMLPLSNRERKIELTDMEVPVFDGQRILVMDDEEVILDLVVSMFKLMNLTTVVAKDGRSAVEAYKEACDSGKCFSAVILDLTVPGGMGGEKTFQELKKIDPKVKAIVSSGYADSPVLSDHRSHGFAAVIFKPYDLVDIGTALKKVLG